MKRHNLPLARHAEPDMSAIGWVRNDCKQFKLSHKLGYVLIANSSLWFISPVWLASIAEGDSIINTTLL